MHALVTGAAAEPDLQVAFEEGHRAHVDGAGTAVRLLQQMGPSGNPSTPRQRRTFAAITDFRFALLIRDSYG